MVASKEIRWFFDHENKQISDWFASKNCKFETTKPRTDYYKKLHQDNLSIKLREGNVEVKERIGKGVRKQIGKLANGYFENWAKWSFNVNTDDAESKNIIFNHDQEWIDVLKSRIGLKVILDQNGNYQFLPISDRVDYGCQIEYTRIQTKGKIVYTFGLEWFGDIFIEIEPILIDAIIGNSILGHLESFGYSEFLNRL